MMASTSKILVTAAAASLALTQTAAADPKPKGNPYVAGDMHNHNTCADGSVSAKYSVDRSVASGVAASGGQNFDLDWFTLGNHGGSGNRDCRFSDNSANLPGDTTHTWDQTLGQTIDGVTVTSLKGTPNGNNMWRWQSIEEVEYRMIVGRTHMYRKVLVEGLEWVTPGHEHTDVAVLSGQTPAGYNSGNASKMAEFEFRFDRSDTDAIGPVDANNQQVWTGKDNVNNSGDAGHAKALAGLKWLQANHPRDSYAIPTHTERQGPYSSTGNKGFNIESFRDFNNAAPTVAFGIESPGHLAQGGLNGGSGSYGSGAVGGGTYGMAGVYTAKVGGLWDGMLGEGRNFFNFVSSDWHERGVYGARDASTSSDFMPGEYTKLYVPNTDNFSSQSIIDGMRSGNSYSVNGDIIGPDMVFRAKAPRDGGWKTMGETMVVRPGDKIQVEMEMTVPARNNSPYSFNNPLLAQVGISQPLNKPSLDHVDLITGQITGPIDPTNPLYKGPQPNAAGVAGAAIVYNTTTAISQQFSATQMHSEKQKDGSTRLRFTTTFVAGNTPFYIRARGTNIPPATPNVTDSAGNALLDSNNAKVDCSDAACPAHMEAVNGVKKVTHDVQAYSNLWFYANPIFVRPEGSPKLLVEKNAELAQKLASKN
ncbi:hypothetical protein MTX26_30550 [Bradyrhizobium sp. ISRA443]|uniref:hypothetical protein n=1 Tax=unclassified Bradyrhizobium TaxID=2631580 RepID=UPI002479C8AF|nr:MULTISPECIES: hypothetical protein [unclassified Bradyrhizobium]WGR95901.1 hypothetical protein MTX20_05540 [Bradyrhizobium sp. ISRA435]WGS02865.1 hypothetical protein MTX23_30535 [Bradyrhizobium sp. ISRA436]WGS09752.1 hypothetical protein MTX18_30555 [Bradyrhizobium sp. ISRA437]WGS16634.1 hypothetical protein MTX26_30550 [Bradyrhizobium sp. ISRA443]